MSKITADRQSRRVFPSLFIGSVVAPVYRDHRDILVDHRCGETHLGEDAEYVKWFLQQS
jgi:hypothetical protein